MHYTPVCHIATICCLNVQQAGAQQKASAREATALERLYVCISEECVLHLTSSEEPCPVVAFPLWCPCARKRESACYRPAHSPPTPLPPIDLYFGLAAPVLYARTNACIEGASQKRIKACNMVSQSRSVHLRVRARKCSCECGCGCGCRCGCGCARACRCRCACARMHSQTHTWIRPD